MAGRQGRGRGRMEKGTVRRGRERKKAEEDSGLKRRPLMTMRRRPWDLGIWKAGS